MSGLVLRDVELGRGRVDVAIADGAIATIAPTSTTSWGACRAGTEVIDARGGALLPGLWDHHLHLLSLAAARRSVDLGGTRGGCDLNRLREATGTTPPGQWIRAVGYYPDGDEIDRLRLDHLAPNHPVRVQHSSGAMWVLNSRALDALELAAAPAGLERDAQGDPTGRVYGADAWLSAQLGALQPPDLVDVGVELARYGVVGVTDATPFATADALDALAGAAASIPQHVVATGGPQLAGHSFPERLRRGPVKVLLADHALPSVDDAAGWIRRAHDADRAVMVHAVSRASLVLALAAWDTAGARPGDRIEHGSVIPPELHAPIRRHGLTVVTQPNFIAERGDRYLAEVDSDDVPHLYPCHRLLNDGIPVGGSTDAPFGSPDPWAAIAAATARTSPSGHRVGNDDPVPAERALRLFLTAPEQPGGPERRIEPGQPVNLCLLDRPVVEALAMAGAGAGGADLVAATVIAGRAAYVRR